MFEFYIKVAYVLLAILGTICIFYCFICIVSDKLKARKKNSKEYSISIYDLNGKLVMSFVAFNVDGNDNTIFYEDRDGKQRIVYVPTDAIVTIEEV